MKISKALRFTLLFAAIGVFTTISVVYVQRDIMSTYAKNLALIKLGDYVRTEATHSRLKAEQGANTEAMDILAKSVQLVQDAYSGKSTSIGDFGFSKDDDTALMLKTAMESGENLRLITSELSGGRKGAEMTDRYDQAYQKFQGSLDALIGKVDRQVQRDKTMLSALSWVTIGLVFVSFCILCWLIYRLQRASDLTAEASAKKLEEETTRVNKMSGFIEAISAGNYDLELQATDDNDNLTRTLVSMRDKLKQNSEDDRKRNWSTTGEAQIGEILRASATNASELYDNIIKFLVKYTKSNQGGLFIYNDDPDEQYLELVACYAFERKKFLTKRIEPGDGLVGQSFLEGDTIYLQEVPPEYVSITSGLGGSTPGAVLLVPMKVNDKIYGVIELASFNTYDEYQIQLVEKLAESIASTISNVSVNETTRVLLEKTQQQAEEMRSQEEEIRQNMEELEATQEEMRRKQAILERELEQSNRQADSLKLQESRLQESQQTLQAIVDNIPRAIFWKDRELRFMGCNKIFASVAGASSTFEIIGKTDFDMPWSAQAEGYRKDDMDVMRTKKGKLDIEELNINSDGAESWVKTSKVPIVTGNGDVVAILGMFEDITPLKRREAEVVQKLQERDLALKEIQRLKELLEKKNA